MRRGWQWFRGLPAIAQAAAWVALALGSIVVAAVAARPDGPTEFVFTVPEPTAPDYAPATGAATVELTAADRKGPAYVSRAQFGADWPLTVKEGRLRCDETEGFHAVFLKWNGRWYAVNGIARITTTNPKIDELLADAPGSATVKRDVMPLIFRGLELCE